MLLLISLLTALAVGVLEAVRRHGQTAQRSFEVLQASELADSAIRLLVLQLGSPEIQSAAESRAHTYTVDVFGQLVVVQLELEAGRVDLNFADESLLTAVFAGNGFDAEEARGLAARIIDWRDSDDVVGERGAERQDYARAGRASGPRNGAFETVSELRQVLGAEVVTADLLDAFTVYTHEREARQRLAVAPVMSGLRWAEANRLDGRTWITADAGSSDVAAQPAELAGEVIRLRACATAVRVTICRTAVFRFTGNPLQPVLMFAWDTDFASLDKV